MEIHQLRVVSERFDLSEKMDKLSKFLDTDTYRELAAAEQVRLLEQLGIMHAYPVNAHNY